MNRRSVCAGAAIAACALNVWAACARTPVVPDSATLAALSGTWTGAAVITQAGTCVYTGDPRPAVTMTWSVIGTGAVTIAENGEGLPATWTGSVSPSLFVNLLKTHDYACGGVPSSYRTSYSGTIVNLGHGGYRLDMRATEDRCPPSCRFDVAYSIAK